MTQRRSLIELAASVLSAEAERGPGATEDARAKASAAMGSALRRRQRSPRLRWAMAGTLAIAGAAAAVVLVGSRAPAPHETVSDPHPSPAPAAVDTSVATALASDAATRVRRGGSEIGLPPGQTLHAADRVVVGGHPVTLGLFRGTRLTLDPATELTLASGAPVFTFDLGSGGARADVAKLRGDERFVVRTADAEIEVCGTSFRVLRAEPRPSCGGGTTTRLIVLEGIVAVRSKGVETLVHGGESWPAGCAEPATHSPRPSAVALPKPSAAPAPSSAPAAAPTSHLAAENDMFARALAQKRAGDAASAVATLDELLALHASTTLAQSALAERMKLLYAIDPARGRAAALDYLTRYPNGFARSDAQVILEAR